MNTKQRIAMIFVLLFSLALSSCAPGQLFGPTATPTSTSTPAATSTPVATSTPAESPEEIKEMIADAVKTACQMKPARSPTVGVSTGGTAVAQLCPDVDSSITLPDEWTAKTPGDLLYVVEVQNATVPPAHCGPYTEVINGTPTGPGGIYVDRETSSVNISLINTQTGQVVNSTAVRGPEPSCPQTVSNISPLIGAPPSAQDIQKGIVDLMSNQVSGTALITIWNTLTGGGSSVAFSPDGKLLASGFKVWDVASGQEVRTLKGLTSSVNSVAFSPDGKLLASGSEDSTVILWDVASGKKVNTLARHTSSVTSVAFSPDGKLLASGSGDNTVVLWDVANWKEVNTLTVPDVTSVTFSPDGKLLASDSASAETVILWDVASGQEVNTLKSAAMSRGANDVAFSPNGKLLASASITKVILWDVASGQEVNTLTGHTSGVTSVAFSPDGKLLAAGGDLDTKVILWDVASGQQVDTLTGTNVVTSVAFSPDGKLLAAASSWDNNVQLWEVKLP